MSSNTCHGIYENNGPKIICEYKKQGKLFELRNTPKIFLDLSDFLVKSFQNLGELYGQIGETTHFQNVKEIIIQNIRSTISEIKKRPKEESDKITQIFLDKIAATNNLESLCQHFADTIEDKENSSFYIFGSFVQDKDCNHQIIDKIVHAVFEELKNFVIQLERDRDEVLKKINETGIIPLEDFGFKPKEYCSLLEWLGEERRKKVEYLALDKNILEGTAVFKKIARVLPNIKKLNISYKDADYLAKYFDHDILSFRWLRSLSVSDFSGNDLNRGFGWLAYEDYLTNLELIPNNKIEKETFEEIVKIKGITKLTIKNCHNLTPHKTHWLCKKLSNLKDLKIIGCKDIVGTMTAIGSLKRPFFLNLNLIS